MKSHTKAAVPKKPRAPQVRGRRGRPSIQPRDRATRASRAPTPQAKLTVGPADDPYEREADATASRIVAMSAPVQASDVGEGASPGSPNGVAPLAAHREGLGGQPELTELDQDPGVPADHEEPALSAPEDVETESLDSGDVAEIERGEPDEPTAAGEDAQARRSADLISVGREGGQAPSEVAALVRHPSHGDPLPTDLRQFVEPRFVASFADVRVHATDRDRAAAHRIGARAFTFGRHIWLGRGERADDKRLMAHELTHVLQQTGRRGRALGHQRERPNRAVAGDTARPMRRAVIGSRVQRGWVAEKIEGVARNIPGYTLLTVLLGRSPITGKTVRRTAVNIVGGFLGLVPGGTALFDKLRETRAIEDAFAWVSQRLGELDISWDRVKRAIAKAKDLFSIRHPLESIKPAFVPLFRDIVTFAGDVKDKVLEFIVRGALKLAGPFAMKVWEVITKASDTIKLIAAHPLQFARNLIGAVIGGFRQFGSRILDHLKKGMLGWLVGAMRGIDIQIPARLDLKGMVSIVTQVLGLTWARIRGILVKRLAPHGERKVSFLEKAVSVVRLLVKEGILGVWRKLLGLIDNLRQTVIGGIKDWLISTVVRGGLSWLAGISNPVGAIVKIVLAIYNMIVVFIERFRQILDVANSIFSSIGAIARGQTKKAADFVEQTIGRTVPVVISFVAALIPVKGIPQTIRKIVERLRQAVAKAIDRFVAFLVKKAKKLLAKILGKLNSKRKTPEHSFRLGKRTHSLAAVKSGKKLDLVVRSKEVAVDQAQASVDAEAAKARDKGDSSEANKKFDDLFDKELDEAQATAAKVDPTSQKTSEKKDAAKADADMANAAKKITDMGPDIERNPYLDTEPDGDAHLIRAQEPRSLEIDGNSGPYAALGKVTKRPMEGMKDRTWSMYYENDHVPEKQIAKKLQKDLGKLRKGAAAGDQGKRDGPAEGNADPAGPLLGTLDTLAVGDDGNPLPAISIYRPIHLDKTERTRANPKAIVEKALGEKTADDRVRSVRQQVQVQINLEIGVLRKAYAKDPGASKEAKSKVDAGLSNLYALNAPIFGTPASSELPKVEAKSTAKDPSLPMSGSPERGIPDFGHIEGIKTPYRSKPPKLGKYLEFDHVIDARYAEVTRDLDFRAAEQRRNVDLLALSERKNGGRPLSDDQRRRLRNVRRRPIFAGLAVRSYERDSAGTIAIYRPVHRVVSAQMPRTFDPIRNEPAGFFDYAADFALKGDEAKVERARDIAAATASQSFSSAMQAHIDLIKKQYAQEYAETAKINPDPRGMAKMDAIVARVARSLGELRAESLNLLR